MANPQKEEGYTAIANEIMDALCRIRIPGEEMQVLNVILRKTYGWKKCEDAISLSQFVEMTGMNKPHIIQSVKGLLLKKVILVTENGKATAKVYKFNKDYDQWKPLPKKVMLPKTVKSVTENGNLPLPKTVPTKEKKNLKAKKEIYTQDFLIFWSAYPNKKDKDDAFKAWKKRNGKRPPIEVLLNAIEVQKEWRERASPEEFRPAWKNPATWINKGSWEGVFDTPESSLDSWARKKQAEMEAAKSGTV